MDITIHLPDDTYQALKALAAQNGQDPAQLVVEWITQKEGEARVDQLFASDPEWNPTQALNELAAGQGEHYCSTEELFRALDKRPNADL